MKNYLNKILIFCVTCAVFSCKKNRDDIPVVPDNKPTPVEHGTLIDGTKVQQTIGVTGGIIEVPNSAISVTVPAGALTDETNFSIQEVTSTIGPNGLGKSYRLLPENISFKKDIEIAFKYSDKMLGGKFEDLLFMAYQDEEGYWRSPKNVVLDKVNKTLKVKTRHFSDWSGYCSANLTIDKKELSSDEEAILKGTYYFTVNDAKNPDHDDLLVPVLEADNNHVGEWSVVSGLGKVTQKEDGTAIFKAPAKITDFSTSKVQLIFKNIRDPRTGVEGLVLAYTDVKLVPTEYIAWALENGENFITAPAAKFAMDRDGKKHLVIFDPNLQTELPFTINVVVNDGMVFPFNYIPEVGTADVFMKYMDQSFGVGSIRCGLNSTPGTVMFEYVNFDGYTKGSVSGSLMYLPLAGCSDMRMRVEVRFRIKTPQ